MDAFHVSEGDRIAFTGAGGKTSAIFNVARDIQGPVLVTTTTHLGTWQSKLADFHYVLDENHDFETLKHKNIQGITLITGKPNDDNRLEGLNPQEISNLVQLAASENCPLLIEADGSRGKPLKAPAAYEPVIPDFVTKVVTVVGMSGYGKVLSHEYVHRHEIFTDITGLKKGESITVEAIEKLLSSPNGGKKGIPLGVKSFLLVNQVENDELMRVANSLADRLIQCYESVAIGSMEQGEVFSCKKRIAGIILAAGEASRLGSPKQLLPWRGKTFINSVVETALFAGLDPVVVVIGAYGKKVNKEVEDYPVIVVENPNWQQGQSTSVKAGINALPDSIGGVLFLLADQPQINVEFIRALIERAYQTPSKIIAPIINGKRVNPVYFDRTTFEALNHISGAKGGSAIFSQFSPECFEWNDLIQTVDVDTDEDLIQLRKFE